MVWASAVFGLAFAAGAAADSGAQEPLANPSTVASGAADHLRLSLYRGAVIPPEGTVITTPRNCAGTLSLELQWSALENQVELRLRGRRALEWQPDVVRTEGVDYEPNPHSPEPKDIQGGKYRLWMIGAAGAISTFYYDKDSYALIGGGPNFDPPTDAIPLEFPTKYMFPTPAFEPNKSGNVDFQWSFAYDRPPLGEFDEYSYYTIAFVPDNLCEFDQFNIDKTTLRQYVNGPFSADSAHPWSDYLAGGLQFDVTLQPAYEDGPPQKTTVGTYSNATTLGGGVPKGWNLDLEAELAGLAPPINPWPGADTCEQTFAGFHTGVDSCQAL